MLNIYADCNVWGANFSPTALEKDTGIVFQRKNEPGQIADSGRYRNQPLPYGSATLVLREGRETGEIVALQDVDFVAKHLAHFRKAGATKIVIDIVVAYGGQCNLEMNPEFLSAVASLGIPLTLSCYEDETLRED
jgi:hypothetical protein